MMPSNNCRICPYFGHRWWFRKYKDRNYHYPAPIHAQPAASSVLVVNSGLILPAHARVGYIVVDSTLNRIHPTRYTPCDPILRSLYRYTWKKPSANALGFLCSCLATSYFPRSSRSKYHRRWRSSRSCSGWERVFPLRHSHQTG